jgi:hypothetical protein
MFSHGFDPAVQGQCRIVIQRDREVVLKIPNQVAARCNMKQSEMSLIEIHLVNSQQIGQVALASNFVGVD